MDYNISFDKYVDFEKGDAYDLYSDEKNLVIFKRILIVLSIILGISLVISILNDEDISQVYYFFRLVFLIVVFCCIVLLLYKYKKIFNVSNIRRNITIFIVSTIVVFTTYNSIGLISLKSSFPFTTENIIRNKEVNDSLDNAKSFSSANDTISKGDSISKINSTKNNIEKKQITLKTSSDNGNESRLKYSFYFCFIILFLYLTKAEYLQLYSLAYGLPFISQIIITQSFVFKDGLSDTIVYFFLTLLSLIISNTLNSKRQRKFFRLYDYYKKKNYESLRMKKELDYARQIQLSMLPESRKIINGVRISATSIPAMEVGGDYFDYFELPEGKVGVFICDVSGHGVASALMLSGLRSSIHLILEDTYNPKVIFEKLNLMIRKTQQRKMFVTAIFAIIDPSKNICSFFNAGHLPPYKIDSINNELFLLKRHGVTLGVFENISPDAKENEVTIDFKTGDKLILYTDGLNEALNKDREEYGFERIENLLNNNLNASSEEILSRIIVDVNNFMDGKEQIDDLTVVIIENLRDTL